LPDARRSSHDLNLLPRSNFCVGRRFAIAISPFKKDTTELCAIAFENYASSILGIGKKAWFQTHARWMIPRDFEKGKDVSGWRSRARLAESANCYVDHACTLSAEA
jgi:hypothetical protein